MSSNYLTLTNISKAFGDFNALKNINLAVKKGELVCFLGPSGCGKTTLLRIIAGLEKQTTGSIHQMGNDISSAPPIARDYGIVFQSYALFPNLTVEENVVYGLTNRRQSHGYVGRRADELLHMVGLQAIARKYPAQISGGQQQRVALARALATSPGLLLLDEPLSALDATVRVHLRNEIRSLQKKLGITTIMVTHDQEEALSMADCIVVMNHGVVEQVGNPLEVYRNPASPFVANFVGKVNCLDAVVIGNHKFQCGELQLECPKNKGTEKFKAGDRVKLYLRPEDSIIGEQAQKENTKCIATVKHIEFLGSNCLAEVLVDRIPDQPLQLQFSLNQMNDFNVKEGCRLHLAMRTDRINVFPL
ncbi:MAG: putative 2-aminoethylphosphonate ABC transporter ATP-binding protein [Saezia sp.]